MISELARFKAMFLVEGKWRVEGPNPLEKLSHFKGHERTMSFLHKKAHYFIVLEHVSQNTTEQICRENSEAWHLATETR
ncbi:hypothetical protein OK016_24710 [Vibrio chagasii]|nr:hypothetical protein [Vibrio chagasii]